MSKSPLNTVLLVVLAISALFSVGLCWSYISSARELRKFQTDATMINNNRALIQALCNDAMEYSKKNPAIDPILEVAGLKPGKTNLPLTSPKPATK